MQKATLSVPEAAKVLGISRSLLYQLVKTGQIRSLKLGQRRVVIPVSVIEQMLSSEMQEPAKTAN